MASQQQGLETFSLVGRSRPRLKCELHSQRSVQREGGGWEKNPRVPVGVSGEEGEPSEVGAGGGAVSQRAEEGRIARQGGWGYPGVPLREAAGGPAGELAALGKPLQHRSPHDGRKRS